ncbi:DUF1684 domain-containing protein, partial [Allorhizocola rhizosphaerae]|uniref:DUF1684 domain-containing protein n=1 Tax=Allorhizocola rhizosphaerae TaxID=1872709 RepID=UPI0013C2FA4D
MTMLELADFRERVARLYLSDVDLDGFRRGRAELFATHPQSPLAPGAPAPAYFPPNPGAIVDAVLAPADGGYSVDTGDTDGVVAYRRLGIAATPFGPLTLFWIDAYGGGLFLPFRDTTAGTLTYGGGRYLTDTVKGTFGRGVRLLGPDRVRLDFNYAYNPSCAYSPRWTCPLA